ncbi:nitroreductase [Amycolatopsis thermophila]|uniref:Nitroreductase n=1 Tax=Amycolatopsis thermophila TaxID=206084 RepID=A0ABU0F324_9PSEU|nr:nitroreductase [Amycolatopsis thermophila]
MLTGAAKRRVCDALLHAHDHVGPVAEREYDYQPPAEAPRSRTARTGGSSARASTTVSPVHTAARLAHHRRNYDFFGAPVGIVLTVSREPREGALVDAGLYLQALMLAARGFGLDTCAQASLIDFYPVLRRHLEVPDDQLIVCGLALGYADPVHLLSGLRTPREPLDAFATFHE